MRLLRRLKLAQELREPARGENERGPADTRQERAHHNASDGHCQVLVVLGGL